MQKNSQIMNVNRRGGWVLSTLLAVSLIAPDARAVTISDVCDAKPTPSGTPTPTPTTVAHSDSYNQQKAQYCAAAKAAQKAAGADDITGKVYLMVAGVCAVACASSFMGGEVSGTGQYCTYGNYAAMGVDALESQKMDSLMSGLLGAFGGNQLGGGKIVTTTKITYDAGGHEHAKTVKKTEDDKAACITMLTAGLTYTQKQKSASASKQSAQENLVSAMKLHESESSAVSASQFINPTSYSASGGSLAGGASTSGAASTAGGKSDPVTSDSTGCTTAQTTGSLQAAVSCATASGSPLPPFVNTGEFANDVHKMTGNQTPALITGTDRNPAQSIASAMGSPFGSDGPAKMADLLKSAVPSMMASSDVAGSAYMAGGGGSGGARSPGSDAGAGLSQFMQNMMDQMGKKGGDAAANGVSAQNYGAATAEADPTAVMEDRRINIFDRVTSRYSAVGKRILK